MQLAPVGEAMGMFCKPPGKFVPQVVPPFLTTKKPQVFQTVQPNARSKGSKTVRNSCNFPLRTARL